jgi:hypothetical protein
MKGIVVYDTSAYRIGIAQCSGMLHRKSNVFHGEFDSVQSTRPKKRLCSVKGIALSSLSFANVRMGWQTFLCSCSGNKFQLRVN